MRAITRRLLPSFLFLVAAACSGTASTTEIGETDGGNEERRDAVVSTPSIDGGDWAVGVAPYDGCTADGPAARFLMEQPPPALIAAGSTFEARVTFANCGPTTWTAATDASRLERGVKLAAAEPVNNEYWTPSRVLLPGDVPPAHSVTVALRVTAPVYDGTYGYQWRFVDEWVEWIEGASPRHDVTIHGGVGPAHPVTPFAGCEEGAGEVRFLAETHPTSTMMAGRTEPVSITVANCGLTVWAAAESADAPMGVKLGLAEGAGPWGLDRVAFGANVPSGYQATLPFSVRAPEVNGSYRYQWAVVDEWVRWMDPASPEAIVTVVGGREPEPAFTLHGREEWVGSEPVSGNAMTIGELRYITVHYNGGSADLDGADDVYQDSDFARYIRNDHGYYLRSRGYSLGYNSMIAPDGDEWEVRGFTYRSAANGCSAVNRPGYAIQVALPSVTARPTAPQIAGLRHAIARIRAYARGAGNPHTLTINGHRDVRPLCGSGGTGCPGEALYELVRTGALEP
jgi:hypothetical protein